MTEAEEPASAPEMPPAPQVAALAPPSAPRPPSRPARAAPAPEPAPETPAETQPAQSQDVEPDPEPAPAPSTDTSDAEADALAAALASTPAPSAPAAAANPGPPMTGGEQDAFRVAVQQCWNVDVGSEAARVTLTVAFDLDPQGRVQGDVRRVSGDGGSEAAIEAAYQSARRAILRCEKDGYVLPADKYEQWKEVEMTFDPSGMRMR